MLLVLRVLRVRASDAGRWRGRQKVVADIVRSGFHRVTARRYYIVSYGTVLSVYCTDLDFKIQGRFRVPGLSPNCSVSPSLPRPPLCPSLAFFACVASGNICYHLLMPAITAIAL